MIVKMEAVDSSIDLLLTCQPQIGMQVTEFMQLSQHPIVVAVITVIGIFASPDCFVSHCCIFLYHALP
jgi:hypothetical protein